MPHIKVNGVNLYYEKAGHGEETLVFIHGNVGSARWWDLIWPQLVEKYTILRVDLRGCGQSERPGQGHTVPQYSEDVRALIKELGLQNVFVIGHSMGGSITMDIAVHEPQLVKGMVLVNSAPAEGFVTPEERKPLIERMIGDRNLMKMSLAAVMPTAAQGDFFEAIVDDAMVAAPTMISNYTSLGEADYRDRLAEKNIPTLIVFGTQDSLISLDMIERTRDAIRSSKLVLYEGIGHSPNVEAPERLVEDIDRFADKIIR